jgi:hypothetical protein
MYLKKHASEELGPGRLLWHYTDFAGLNGIVNGTMWASNLRFLNDTQEFRYAVEIAMKVLSEELRNDGDHFKSMLASLRKFMGGYAGNEFYVISFSQKEDDLAQWRGYGTDGRPSFAVGFDPKTLEEKAADADFSLHRVLYEDDEIARSLAAELLPLIQLVRKHLAANPSITPKKFTDYVAPGILITMLPILPRYKHPKFKVEEEWRLIRRQPILKQTPFLELKFRQKGSLVVPYYELPLHELAQQQHVLSKGHTVESPIGAITIGPTPHQAELEFAVGEMTSRNGLHTVMSVRHSEIPYRNW